VMPRSLARSAIHRGPDDGGPVELRTAGFGAGFCRRWGRHAGSCGSCQFAACFPVGRCVGGPAEQVERDAPDQPPELPRRLGPAGNPRRGPWRVAGKADRAPGMGMTADTNPEVCAAGNAQQRRLVERLAVADMARRVAQWQKELRACVGIAPVADVATALVGNLQRHVAHVDEPYGPASHLDRVAGQTETCPADGGPPGVEIVENP